MDDSYRRGMALSIRNKDTESAVRRLAARTGLGLTEAIDEAVTRRLAELDRERDDHSDAAQAARAERVRRVLDEFLEGVNPDNLLTDEDLYDERGLAR